LTRCRYAAAAVFFSCCVPLAASASLGHAPRVPRVLYHPTYRMPTAPLGRARAATPYAGTVVTIPAILDQPAAEVYDSNDGDVYVVDDWAANSTQELLRVSPHGATTRVAALPSYSILAITFDPQTDRFYLTGHGAQFGSSEFVFAVTPHGSVSVLAGGASTAPQDGTGPNAGFANLGGITYDSKNGLLYAVDGSSIRVITTAGKVTTLAGSIAQAYTQDVTPIAYDAKHNRLVLALPGSNAIVAATTGKGTLTTIAGQCYSFGQPSTQNCDPLERDGPAGVALFAAPNAVAVNPADGTIYVADDGNDAIRRIDPSNTVSTLAGNGVAAELDGAGLAAEFAEPAELALDPVHGALYTIDGTPSEFSSGVGTFRSVTTGGVVPPPPATPIALFDTATPDRQPFALDWRATTPASTVLWYTETTGELAALSPSGVSTEITDPYAGGYSGPQDIVLGADGSQWFYDPSVGSNLVHHTKAGFSAVTVPGNGFPTPSLGTLTQGPGGNIWFALNGVVGYVTPGGKLTSLVTSSYPSNGSLAAAADSTIWLASGGALTQYSRAGKLLQTIAYQAGYVARGPDGNVWFSQSDAIGTIRANGVLVVYPLTEPIAGCLPNYTCSRGIGELATGPDGALWFVEKGTPRAIGRLTVDGLLQEYPVLAARSNPNDVSAGPDGNVWFVDAGAQKIGRIMLTSSHAVRSTR